MDLNRLARDLVKNNIYLTLCTTDGKKSWAAPLYYVTDENYSFYFFSNKNSRHSKHIQRNPNVSAAIFDSHQQAGTGNGIQMKAKSYIINLRELPKIILLYGKKILQRHPPKYTLHLSLKKFIGKSSLRFYKIIPDKVYLLDPDDPVGKRVEVKL